MPRVVRIVSKMKAKFRGARVHMGYLHVRVRNPEFILRAVRPSREQLEKQGVSIPFLSFYKGTK